MKNIAGGAAVLGVPMSLESVFAANEAALGPELKGKIRHSVCKWCYNNLTLEELASKAKEIGLSSIELVGEEGWPTLKKHGLTCALPSMSGLASSLTKGFNDPKNHDELIASFEAAFPKIQAAGYNTVICFSGNRSGMSDIDGMMNCAAGLKKLMKSAEKHKITMIMELLNSKVDHKDYMCDHTAWGAALCEMVGSENFKLLYDIYHMQIMEGDVIATIRKYHQYIGHYHTGGVPGRNEIDETQELNYPAIMKAIYDTGFKGFVGQEFIPKRDPLTSLKQGVQICDI